MSRGNPRVKNFIPSSLPFRTLTLTLDLNSEGFTYNLSYNTPIYFVT